MPQAIWSIAVALVLGIGVPWLGIRMLVPSLERSEAARRVNYRGRPVFIGLGIVWLLWAGGAIAASLLLVGGDSGPSAGGLLILAGPLALVTFSLGMVDDALGCRGDRGFGGHLRALAEGRLTTGMLKLIGISAACIVTSVLVAGFAPWGRAAAGAPWLRWASIAVAAACVALTSNLLNLFDLRPARAVKVYLVLGCAGALVAGISGARLIASLDPPAAYPGMSAISVAVLGLFVLGPALAVWRYDAGAHGMFGDAGANPAGAVVGLLVLAGLPLWGLLAYFGVVVALNVASEAVSFSQVIEASPVLHALDQLGRAEDQASQAASDGGLEDDAARVGSEG